jgi:hypothetical protein
MKILKINDGQILFSDFQTVSSILWNLEKWLLNMNATLEFGLLMQPFQNCHFCETNFFNLQLSMQLLNLDF